MISRRNILAGGLALAATPSWAHADASGPVHIPVDFSQYGMPILSVTIGGKGPFRFALDTGAETNLIKPDLAKSLGLQAIDSVQTYALNGHALAQQYLADNIVFGGGLRQSRISVLALSDIGDYDGMLAAGFLTSLPSELDYGAGEIRLYPSGGPNLAGYLPIPGGIEQFDSQTSPRMFCQLTIDGLTLKVMIDTGSPRELLLYPDAVRTNKLWDKYPTFTPEISRGATGATSAARVVTMPDLRLGDIHVASLDVKLLDPTGHQASNHHQGLLGSQFLQNFSLTVGRGKVALRPNADTAPPKG